MDNINELSLHLTEEEKERWHKLRSVFESDGWPLIKEWAQGQVTLATISGANAVSWDVNRVAYGTRLAWEEVANFEDRVANEYAAVAEQRAEAALEDDYDDLS